jgi:hypothetical protein
VGFAAVAGCARVEPTPSEKQLVPLDLVALTGRADITRAYVDGSLSTISTATVIVFDGTEDKVLQYRHLDYAAGERIFLQRGRTFRVFAVANLTDANCPNGSAATYFDDVETMADLDDKYFISTTAATAKPTVMPMTSIGENYPADPNYLDTQIVTLDVDGTSQTIAMRSLYTKISLNIYNKTNGTAYVTSDMDIVRYLTKNLPRYSWLIERPRSDTADYAQSPDSSLAKPAYGYAATDFVDISYGEWTTTAEAVNGNSYVRLKQNIDLYTLENRRGTKSEVTTMYDRKKYAPPFALEINLIGYATVDYDSRVLETHLLIGKGREASPTPDGWMGNYDVDRNCIYHVDVFFDGVGNIDIDSRRNYLDLLAVCGDLTPPTDGTPGEF